VNLPGYSYELVGPDSDPRANPCPADTYQFGLRKQRACVPCPPGLGTENKTMQTSVAACGKYSKLSASTNSTLCTGSPWEVSIGTSSVCSKETQQPWICMWEVSKAGSTCAMHTVVTALAAWGSP